MPEIIVKLGDNVLQKYFFVKETMNIGRAPDNQVVVENLAVSRSHAIIREDEGRYLITDLDSSNGTFVNGVRIKKTELIDRDVIAIGKHKLYFYDQRAAETALKSPVFDADRTMMFDQSPAAPPEAELLVTNGRQKGQHFALNAPSTTIGRGAMNDIRLSDWFVSKEHAVIERRGRLFVLRDLDSWRHTLINGTVVQEAPLTHRDHIQFGPTVQAAFCVKDIPQEGRPSARVPVELAKSASLAPLERFDPEPSEPEPPTSPAQDEPDLFAYLSPAAMAVRELEEEIPDAASEPVTLEFLTPEPGELEAGPSPRPASPVNGTESQGPEKRDEINGLVENIATYSLQAAALSAKSPIQITPNGSSDPWTFLDNSDDPASAREVELKDAGPDRNGKEKAGLDAPAAASPDLQAVAAAQSEAAQDSSRREIQMWERALSNKNPIIRKQAARRLKQLTGRDYEY